MTAKLSQQAADPKTSLEVLADLAYRHPELRAAIAANPSTYPDLLEWLGGLGDPEVDAALRKRNGELTDEELAADPNTDPAMLADLAYRHPELREIIAANPNAYQDLREWIAQAGLVAAPISTESPAPVMVFAEPRTSWITRFNAKHGPTFTTETLTLLVVIAIASVMSLVVGNAAFGAASGLVQSAIQSMVPGGGTGLNSQAESANSYWYGVDSTWETPAYASELNVADVLKGGYGSPLEFIPGRDGWVLLSGFGAERIATGVDPKDGHELWQTTSSSWWDCSPAALNDRLLCVDGEAGLIELNTATGAITPFAWDGSVFLDDARVFVTADDDAFYIAQFTDLAGDHVTVWRVSEDGKIEWTYENGCADYGSNPNEWLFSRNGSNRLNFYFICFEETIDAQSGHLLSNSISDEDLGAIQGLSSVTTQLGPFSLSREGAVLIAQSNGQTLWTHTLGDPDFIYQTMSPGADSPILVATSGGNLVRLDPSRALPRVEGTPTALPDCPSGSSMVAWTEWPGGGVLECRYGSTGELRILLASGNDVTEGPAVLLASGALQADIAGRTIEISLDGWLIVDDGTSLPVRSGWSLQAGPQSYPQLPGNLARCPANTVTTSLSTWAGGWLLTCGIAGDDVTSFFYSVGSASGSGGAMTTSGNGLCGTDQSGIPVCVSAAPAVVTIGDSSVRKTYAVHDNYFDASGFGGAGKGAGAYGVDTPEDTALGQVTYLVGILEKSAQARSKVGGALAPLNACRVNSSDIKALRTLTQSRTDLLAALEFTPVDQIPNGEKVLAALRRTLQLSEKADNGYVDAAIIMNEGSCTRGRTSYRAALAIADKAEAAKVVFVKLWNSTIAKQYGVKSFSSGAI
jgi:hypothetical protein